MCVYEAEKAEAVRRVCGQAGAVFENVRATQPQHSTSAPAGGD